MLTWGNYLSNSSINKAIAGSLKNAGYRVELRPQRQAPFVRLGQSRQAFILSLTSKRRWRIKRGLKKLSEQGPVSFEEVSSSPQLLDHLNAAWELEANTWKGARKTAIAMNPDQLKFYNRLAIRFAPVGKMTLFELRCGGELVSFAYNLLESGISYGLKTSFNQLFAHTDPFKVMLSKIIEWAEEREIKGIDMGGGAHAYKVGLAKEVCEFSTLIALPRTTVGWLVYTSRFGWREAVKKFPYAGTIKIIIEERRRRQKRYGK